MLWGHRNDPENFHRCLQDFDRRLPDLLDALRDGDLLILTSDHGCDPTTPSTDHSREYALLLAYAQGRNAGGQRARGRRVRRRRRDRERVARRQARRGAAISRQADPRRLIVIRPAEVIQRKRDGEELADDELAELVLGYARGEVPDYQMAAFAMAVYFRGLTPRETFALTDAMIRSGETIDLGARARAQGRRQALDRRRRRQDVARGRPDRRRVRRAVREDERPRARAHGRHARQARVDPRLPRRARDRRVRRAGARRRHGDHRPDRRPRPGRPHALRAARRDRDRRPALADRGVDHVEEARRGRAGDRARREGRRRRVHEDARRRAAARRGDARARASRPAARSSAC